MKVALVGAELEENLGMRYMASSLEKSGNKVDIVPFDTEADVASVADKILTCKPDITGLSMVFTGRAREFCNLAQTLRDGGYKGHIIAGGHFASFNYEKLLKDFPAFDSVGIGEGEILLCKLAENLPNLPKVAGLAYRATDGTIKSTPAEKQENLDALPFPKRTTFHEYFGKPIASLLSSRGCWRDCAFCSINAWYKNGGGKRFRTRSIPNLVAEMKELYHKHGIRIFNFQDDNFFLASSQQSLERFKALREQLEQNGVEKIAIAVKARPDSINRQTIAILDDLGLFRVFLGVENASENGLRNLNRKQTINDILNALLILNDFDIHVAFNFLLFEPDTSMDDILTNLRFMERHIDNPFNFCRAEAYAGTGLKAKLEARGALLGDFFGFDYRIKDPRVEVFHKIANFAFFDRNFSENGLHYFNMEVDFYYQILRRFHPKFLCQSLRAAVRNFIKETNLDTFRNLSNIYDFVTEVSIDDELSINRFAREMRHRVDRSSAVLILIGNQISKLLERAYENKGINFLSNEQRSRLMDIISTVGEYRLRTEPEGLLQEASTEELLSVIGAGQEYIPYNLFSKKNHEERR